MAEPRPPARRRRLAATLVELREAADKKPEEAAERIGCHRSKISRIENARLGISLGELRDLLTFYGVEDPDQVEALVSLARRTREPAWVQRAARVRPSYTDFISYEETADRIRSYQGNLIAGLLQTPEYAQAVIAVSPTKLDQPAIDALVTARINRQEILKRAQPPRLCVVQSEAALRLQVGGAAAMRKQLEHLATMAEHPSVEIRVIPDHAGAHAGLTGSFVLFSFPHSSITDVACLEHRTGTYYLESPDEADTYGLIFDSLQAVALNPEDSLTLIAKMRRDM
ncbi:helix-turn-helix domain-containing protein [Streptomyces sp. NPDC002932]|uniref:helix-turn-helix domain-containing protein n=1 Tax=Streptomyces sp. NPDC002932 TaxID=3364672 RepID=UPI0036CA38F6